MCVRLCVCVCVCAPALCFWLCTSCCRCFLVVAIPSSVACWPHCCESCLAACFEFVVCSLACLVVCGWCVCMSLCVLVCAYVCLCLLALDFHFASAVLSWQFSADYTLRLCSPFSCVGWFAAGWVDVHSPGCTILGVLSAPAELIQGWTRRSSDSGSRS